jgi:hypothetical protein
MILYSAASVITVTIATLASAGSARESTVVTNTATRYDDAYVTMTITAQTGTAPAGDKAMYIYLYAAGSGTDYTSPATGTDATIAVTSPSNFFGPAVMTFQSSVAGLNSLNMTIPSVATYFGGIMPAKWGMIFQNSTGMLMSATAGNHSVAFVGVTFTTA